MSTFSTDNDLFALEPELREDLPSGQSSFEKQHEQAHKEIVRKLVKDKIIVLGPRYELDDAEDFIHRPDELNLASSYKVLSMIFRFMSNSADDTFMEKSVLYDSMFKTEYSEATQSLSIDIDKDGVEDDKEVGFNHSVRLRRT